MFKRFVQTSLKLKQHQLESTMATLSIFITIHVSFIFLRFILSYLKPFPERLTMVFTHIRSKSIVLTNIYNYTAFLAAANCSTCCIFQFYLNYFLNENIITFRSNKLCTPAFVCVLAKVILYIVSITFFRILCNSS